MDSKLGQVVVPLGVESHVLGHVLVTEEQVLVAPHGGGHLTGQDKVRDVVLNTSQLLIIKECLNKYQENILRNVE